MATKRWSAVAAWVGGIGLCAAVAAGALAPARPAGQPPGGSVRLPWTANDSKGQTWRVYPGGWLQNQGATPQGGNTQTFSQGAQVTVNGNGPQTMNNQGRVDDKTGELVLENMQVGGITLTRRVFVDKDAGYVRYIDIFRNSQPQDQTVQVVISSNLNYGVSTSQNVEDPKRKGQQLGWAAQTGSMACFFEMYAGKGSKLAPQIMAPPGNNVVQTTYQLPIPANKEVAIMHLHGMVPTQDAGAQFMTGLKEAQLLKNLPTALRKMIVNFVGGSNFIGDLEILRGDLLDVVELKSGDQLKGTLKDPAYEVATFYGPVTLPADRVVAVMNAGQFRPRQLVVTGDGQIFGGRLKKDTLDLQLSSGQVTQIPVGQVSRVGYRKRAGEPEEWTFEKPLVLMQTGERIGVKPPTAPFEVATRYGKLSLRPEQVAAVVLQSEETGAHQIFLSDGGKISGLLAAGELEMTLDAAGPAQTVKFPVSSIARFQLSPKAVELEDTTPTLKLANEDLLVGTITGQLKVDTAFDTITVAAAEVKALSHPKDNPSDVQVTLFDGTILSGQLQELTLGVQTTGDLSLKIPLALLEEYSQPQPMPSPVMVEQIKKVVEALNSKDWKARDTAEESLRSMGPEAITVLKQLRQNQPPEAQQRFDLILKELEKQQKEKSKSGPGGPATGTGPGNPQPTLPHFLVR